MMPIRTPTNASRSPTRHGPVRASMRSILLLPTNPAPTIFHNAAGSTRTRSPTPNSPATPCRPGLPSCGPTVTAPALASILDSAETAAEIGATTDHDAGAAPTRGRVHPPRPEADHGWSPRESGSDTPAAAIVSATTAIGGVRDRLGCVTSAPCVPRDPLSACTPRSGAIEIQVEIEILNVANEAIVRHVRTRIERQAPRTSEPDIVNVPSARPSSGASCAPDSPLCVTRTTTRRTNADTFTGSRSRRDSAPCGRGRSSRSTRTCRRAGLRPRDRHQYALELTIALNQSSRSIPASIHPLGTKAVRRRRIIVDMLNPYGMRRV